MMSPPTLTAEDRRPPPPAEPVVITSIAAREIRQLLSVGATGLVFEAVPSSQDAPVISALHVPFARYQRDADFCARYLRQANQLRRLNHPRLSRVRACGQDEVCWREMERHDGWSLAVVWRRLMSRQLALSRRIALDLILQAGEGLSFLHRHDRAHTRLSMGRLLLLPDGDLKITGWIQPGAVVPGGTTVKAVAEMAPEQLIGQHGTAASDVYRLALIAATLLLGSNPFERRTATAIRESILADQLDLTPLAAPALESLLGHALARSALDRPPMASFLTDLQAIASTLPEEPPVSALLRDLFSQPPAPPAPPEAREELLALRALLDAPRLIEPRDEPSRLLTPLAAPHADTAARLQRVTTADQPRTLGETSSTRLQRLAATRLPSDEPSATRLPTLPRLGVDRLSEETASFKLNRSTAIDRLPGDEPSAIRLQRLTARPISDEASSLRLQRLAAVDRLRSDLSRANLDDRQPDHGSGLPTSLEAARQSVADLLSPAAALHTSGASSTRLPRLGSDLMGSPSSSRLPRLQPEPSRTRLPSLQPPRHAPASGFYAPSLAPAPRHAPSNELLSGVVIGLCVALIAVGAWLLTRSSPGGWTTPAAEDRSVRPSATAAIAVATPAEPAEPAPAAPTARITNLSLIGAPDRLTISGTLEGEARAMGFLVDEPGRCQYRLRLRNTSADPEVANLQIQSPLITGFAVLQEGGAAVLQFDCAPGTVAPSLTTSPQGFSLVLQRR